MLSLGFFRFFYRVIPNTYPLYTILYVFVDEIFYPYRYRAARGTRVLGVFECRRFLLINNR